MFRRLIRNLNNFKNDILKQNIRGHFVSRSLSKHTLVLLVLSITSLTMGCIMTYTYYNLYETLISYSDSTTIPIYFPQSTMYFYIQIDDFYQTNLKYSKSISYNQLKGDRETNSNVTDPLSSRRGKVYYPAGILPNTFFQDGFTFSNLNINTSNISWNSMRKKIKPSGYDRSEVIPPPLWDRYRNIPNLSDNERFINWIYTSPFYNFRKLWGTINVREAGVYNLEIDSKYPYGNKKVFFSQMSWAGTKNYFLSIALITMGIIGLLFTYLLYRKVLD